MATTYAPSYAPAATVAPKPATTSPAATINVPEAPEYENKIFTKRNIIIGSSILVSIGIGIFVYFKFRKK